MSTRHIVEQYYSIRVKTDKKQDVFISGFNGTAEDLAEIVNKSTDKKWQKVRVYKYTQLVDPQKATGSRIVNKRHACLKIDRTGCGSLCTKVDENFTKDGRIPENIRAFFGEQKVKQ